MANVTVLGAGGSTVTIGLSSAENAIAAQLAANTINKLVTGGVLDQVTYAGTGTLPAPAGLLGGLIVTGSGANDVGAQVPQYVASVVNSSGPTTIVGTQNALSTVIAGSGGLTYLNQSKNGSIFLGGGSNGVFNAAVGAAATLGLDGNAVIGVMAGVAGTSMNITAHDRSLTLINDPGENKFAVTAQADASIVVAVQGSGTVAATVVGAGASEIEYLAIGGSAFINPGAGNATIYGNVGSGTTTVFGGALRLRFDGNKEESVDLGPAFTGRLTVVNGRGYFQGGAAGGNIMSTDTVPGSATLVGGGTGDLLFSQASGSYLVAGAGSSTLSGFGLSATVGGGSFFTGFGNATVFGNSGGGNLFGLGGGLSVVDGRNEAQIVAEGGVPIDGVVSGVPNQYFVAAETGGGHGISDFISGVDQFLMGFTRGVTHQDLSSLTFYTAGQSGSPFGTGSGTRMILTGGTIVDFFNSEVKMSDLV